MFLAFPRLLRSLLCAGTAAFSCVSQPAAAVFGLPLQRMEGWSDGWSDCGVYGWVDEGMERERGGGVMPGGSRGPGSGHLAGHCGTSPYRYEHFLIFSTHGVSGCAKKLST